MNPMETLKSTLKWIAGDLARPPNEVPTMFVVVNDTYCSNPIASHHMASEAAMELAQEFPGKQFMVYMAVNGFVVEDGKLLRVTARD